MLSPPPRHRGPVDLFSDPYGAYELLREDAPVHRVPGPDGRPVWLVTRYDDAQEILALLTHPDQLAALRADPSLLPRAVEELARYDGPVLTAIRRFPTEDVRIAGVTVRAGESVLVTLGSANRDPKRFPSPDRLDVTREASGHLALGRGIHYCLGAPLARLEVSVALTTLFERHPRCALAAPAEELARRLSIRARGLLELPVRW